MKIYIFGAGASRGSQPPHLLPEKRAPLINDLFDDQYRAYANDVFVSPSRISELSAQIGDESLEEWLSKEWTKLGTLRGKESLAYGRKMFGELSLYIWWLMAKISTTYNEDNGYYLLLQKLAKRDDKEEQVFVNFNYDLLLDKALTKLYGYNLSSTLTNYTTLNYLKPHGSVNWFLKRRTSDIKVSAYDTRGNSHLEVTLSRVTSNIFRSSNIDKRLMILDPLNKSLESVAGTFLDTFDTGSYGFPLVMLPLVSKMNDLVTGFMSTMQAEFRRVFSQATEVYVIGYRANDELFRDMALHVRQGTKLHVVGQETAKEIQDKIVKLQPRFVRGAVHHQGFLKFIQKM